MKKTLIALLTLLIGFSLSTEALAAGTLTCTAEDGSELRAIVGSEQGSTPHQFSLRVRSGEVKEYPEAWSHFESSLGFVNGHQLEENLVRLVVVDPVEGVLVSILKSEGGYSFIDRTGSYSAQCEFGY